MGQHGQKVASVLAPLAVGMLVGVGRCRPHKMLLDADGYGHRGLEGSGTHCPSAPLVGDCCDWHCEKEERGSKGVRGGVSRFKYHWGRGFKAKFLLAQFAHSKLSMIRMPFTQKGHACSHKSAFAILSCDMKHEHGKNDSSNVLPQDNFPDGLRQKRI